MTEKMIWLVNKNEKTEEICLTELKKFVKFEHNRPVQLPCSIGMKYINFGLRICDNPLDYYKDRTMSHLVVRDAGIGDLIMLEPCLRTLADNGREVTVASCYPQVFEGHPSIKDNFLMKTKADLHSIDPMSFDTWDDLRNYSETCQRRDVDHRTDCYNQKFDLEIKDKEPRLYFTDDELNKTWLEKDKEKIYICVSLDASHYYRRIQNSQLILDNILKANERYVCVLLGGYNFITGLPEHNRIIDFQGKTDIRQMMNIVRQADLLVAVDSGLLHIGLAQHVPTLGIFSIIKPDLRVKYYTGPREIVYPENLKCAGCGSWHMAKCEFGDWTKDSSFVPPCMQLKYDEVVDKLGKLQLIETRRTFKAGTKELVATKHAATPKAPAAIRATQKIVMPIIVQNEGVNLPRFIENVMSHPAIGKVIAIDGGSTDNTVKLLEKAGAFVYVHPYDKNYHDMQALQRNISFSFVADNTPTIFMDIDECFSKELYDYLFYLADDQAIKYGLISRRTFKYYADITDAAKRIKDYPDYQPRWYRWDKKFKFVKSPHHITLNVPPPVKIDKDIIHFEAEGKDREALERQWSDMWTKTKGVYK